jgi:TRAP-type transport system periplasmic protein
MYRLIGAAAAIVGVVGMNTYASAQEQTLRVVTGTPVNLVWNTPLNELIAAVNARGEGVIKMELIGGPEAVPVAEQFRGISTGVFEVQFGPNQYLQGDIPASQVFNGSNRTAMDLRADGAFDALNKFYNEQGNIQYLGYFGSGYQFHLMLTKTPPEGGPYGYDFTGLRVRGTGTFGPFFEKLGITLRDIQVAEVYTALERGGIDGVGWVTLASLDLGFDDFIKARILPTWWQGDLGMTINLDTWNGLSDEAKTILTEEVIAAEAKAHAFFVGLSEKEAAGFDAAGAEVLQIEGEAAANFLDAAYSSRWDEIIQRMGEEDGNALRDLFYRP